MIADTSLCPSSSLVKNTFRYLSKYYRADIGGTRSLVTTRGIKTPPFLITKKRKNYMKSNRRKIKNMLDRYSMYSYLNTFTKISDTILTTKQLNVLGIVLFITKSSTKQKMCIKDLGKYLKCNTHSSLSRLVKSLKTKGFLNTNKEGRVVFISLSTMGINYLNRLYSYFNRQAEKEFNTPVSEDINFILTKGYKERKVA